MRTAGRDTASLEQRRVRRLLSISSRPETLPEGGREGGRGRLPLPAVPLQQYVGKDGDAIMCLAQHRCRVRSGKMRSR